VIIGEVTTVCGSGNTSFVDGVGEAASFNRPFGLVVDNKTMKVYIADCFNSRVRTLSPSGHSSSLSCQTTNLDSSRCCCIDSTMTVINDHTYTGIVTTLAGSGRDAEEDGVGTSASLNWPAGLAFDSIHHHLYVSTRHSIRQITSTGNHSPIPLMLTFASAVWSSELFFSLPILAGSNGIFVSNGDDDTAGVVTATNVGRKI
jgi:DNA-binding beta-propeller fold protein YncE